jgi:hypothetical protein
MQQVEMTNTASPSSAGRAQEIRNFIRHWLTGRRGLIVGGIAVVGAGMALGWNWLTAIGAAPILLSLAPCAAMCALGTCAMMKANSAGAAPRSPDQAIPSERASTPNQPDGQGP